MRKSGAAPCRPENRRHRAARRDASIRPSLRGLRLKALRHGRLWRDLVDPEEHLAALTAKAAIGVSDFAGGNEFLPRLEFVMFPAVVVQVFVEHDDRAGQQEVADLLE